MPEPRMQSSVPWPNASGRAEVDTQRYLEGAQVGHKRKVLLKILAVAVGVTFALAVLSPFLGLRAIAALLAAGQFRLEGIHWTRWLAGGDLHSVPRQSWRHIESGAVFEVDIASFGSNELAASACQTQVISVSLRSRVGTFTGGTIGDECWHWLTSESARLLVRRGRFVVNLRSAGSLPADVTVLFEDVAALVLRWTR